MQVHADASLTGAKVPITVTSVKKYNYEGDFAEVPLTDAE